MIKCYNCQFENKDYVKVCKNCGADLTYVSMAPGLEMAFESFADNLCRSDSSVFVARFFLNKFDRNLPTWQSQYPMYEKDWSGKNANNKSVSGTAEVPDRNPAPDRKQICGSSR